MKEMSWEELMSKYQRMGMLFSHGKVHNALAGASRVTWARSMLPVPLTQMSPSITLAVSFLRV